MNIYVYIFHKYKVITIKVQIIDNLARITNMNNMFTLFLRLQ